jgi:hypothetical protein
LPSAALFAIEAICIDLRNLREKIRGPGLPSASAKGRLTQANPLPAAALVDTEAICVDLRNLREKIRGPGLPSASAKGRLTQANPLPAAALVFAFRSLMQASLQRSRNAKTLAIGEGLLVPRTGFEPVSPP